MNRTTQLLSFGALAATVIPSLLFCAGITGHDFVKWAALAGTAGWFLTAPLWVGRSRPSEPFEAET